MGWMNGRKEPDPVETWEPTLVVRVCGVRRPALEKFNSEDVRAPKSCIPNPDNVPFSDTDLDKSRRPCSSSSFPAEILRRYGLIFGVEDIDAVEDSSGNCSSCVAYGVAVY